MLDVVFEMRDIDGLEVTQGPVMIMEVNERGTPRRVARDHGVRLRLHELLVDKLFTLMGP
jgi:hypothetical protein